MSQINMTSIRSLVLFLALTTIHAQNECSGGSANCINIRNCPQIKSILTDPTPPSEQMLQTLRNAQCGFESNDPKYCCNQVTTTTTIETPPPPDVTDHPNLRLLDHQACGPVPRNRATGGNETEVFQYPWMALIALNEKTIKFPCSGTIISSRYVLSNALCLIGFGENLRVIGVRIGVHDINKERECITDNRGFVFMCAGKYQDFGVDSVHPHPGYTIGRLRDNIGLIRLNGSIDFRPQNIKPICLPFGTAATLNHKRAIVTGWHNRNPEKLLQEKLWLVTNERCKELLNNTQLPVNDLPPTDQLIRPDIHLTYRELCTRGQENSCNKSRGGPLQAAGIYNDGTVRIIQHGVRNYNPMCGYPGVYARVSYYMVWILNTMTD